MNANMKLTVHRDGTVSYWSVYRQVRMVRIPAGRVQDADLEAMPRDERERVIRAQKVRGMDENQFDDGDFSAWGSVPE